MERTFAATTGETRKRADDLLDEASRRGQDARHKVARRGQEAREASAGITQRVVDGVVDAVQDLPLASGDDVRQLRSELSTLQDRVTELERRLHGAAAGRTPEPEPQGQPEGS